MKAKTCPGIVTAAILACFAFDLYGGSFAVINTNDTGDGSLRQAMNLANNSAGKDTILFNIPGTGPHTILPASPLPVLYDPSGVLIDGLSQPGAAAGPDPPATAVLRIELDGSGAGPAHGIDIQSPGNTIRGLVINRFEADGIRILGVPGGTFDNHVYCNFIGTDTGGVLDLGNGSNQASLWAGVYITIPLPPHVSYSAHHNVIEANLVSGNYSEGVAIASCPPADVYENSVLGNHIGTDITGKADLGNDHDGVYIGEKARYNMVKDNLISGNDYSGVGIMGYYDPETRWITSWNYVMYNIIGLDVDFMPLPNTREGVSIGRYGAGGLWGYATNNTIGPGNIIGRNGRNGVLIEEHPSNTVNADSNKITRNTIFNNTLLGIDLGNDGVTSNDSGDPDTGADQFLNFPEIDTAYIDGPQVVIEGRVCIDTDPSGSVVEVFKVISDPSGYGEGAVFLDNCTPDNSGNWRVEVTGVAAGDSVTATVTDNGSNTSEFAQNAKIMGSTGIFSGPEAGNPRMFRLFRNYPNPFNSRTVIAYQLSVPGIAELKIYTVRGKLLRILADGYHEAGVYTACWDGLDASGRECGSGVYVFRIRTAAGMAVRKALLMK